MQKYNVTTIHSSDEKESVIFETGNRKEAESFAKNEAKGIARGRDIIHFSNTYGVRFSTFTVTWHVNETLQD